MRRVFSLLFVAAAIASSGAANAGQIWTDGNGDGLPDSAPFAVAPNMNVTVGVWIDAQSFTWTNYLVYVEFERACLTYTSREYVITGGTNFPIDVDEPGPNYTGFGGFGFNEGGVDHIGNVFFQINVPVNCCVTPAIDPNNPFYVFSQLGTPTSYMLFTTNPGTCYGAPVTTPEACCFPDCSCADLPPADCAAAGGLSLGPGTSCATTFCECPPQQGACCFADGNCVIIDEPNCVASGGVFQGDNTPCIGQCINANESKSWGEVKGLYR